MHGNNASNCAAVKQNSSQIPITLESLYFHEVNFDFKILIDIDCKT